MKPLVNKSLDKYSTTQLQSCLNVIRSQNISGYNQQFGDAIEKYLDIKKQ